MDGCMVFITHTQISHIQICATSCTPVLLHTHRHTTSLSKQLYWKPCTSSACLRACLCVCVCVCVCVRMKNWTTTTSGVKQLSWIGYCIIYLLNGVHLDTDWDYLLFYSGNRCNTSTTRSSATWWRRSSKASSLFWCVVSLSYLCLSMVSDPYTKGY